MVTLGNLLLRDSGYAALRSRRVALLANPTAVFADTLEHLADAMHRDLRAAANASLVAVLSPEHGFRGDHQAEHGDHQYVDNSTGLTVWPAYSLPIRSRAPTLTSCPRPRACVLRSRGRAAHASPTLAAGRLATRSSACG